MGDHGLDQGQPGGDVVAEILFGDGHALAHQGIGGEVDDGLDALFGEQVVQKGLIGHTALVKAAALQGRAVALGQIVRHHHVRAPLQQSGHAVGTDVSRTAGDKNRHDVSLLHEIASVLQQKKRGLYSRALDQIGGFGV